MKDLRSVIDNSEKILWEGKPHRLVYTVGNPFLIVFATFWLIFDLFIMGAFTKGFTSFGADNQFFSFGKIFFLFHLAPVYIIFGSIIYRLFAWSRVQYAVTDRRIYLLSGVIGTDIKSLEHREVENLSVKVGFIENMTNRGTITLRRYGTSSENNISNSWQFTAVEDPYQVYNLIKKVSLDVRTDQNYPNALRPKTNPGYNTEYTPEGE